MSISKEENEGTTKVAEKKICNEFQNKMRLIIDKRTQGSGNSKCGNTACRFFSHVDQVAKINGVNKELITNFGSILKMTASSRRIPTLIFIEFTSRIAKLYASLYPWYYMPSLVHKVLLNREKIMENFMLPIGMYSEQVSEARNKL